MSATSDGSQNDSWAYIAAIAAMRDRATEMEAENARLKAAYAFSERAWWLLMALSGRNQDQEGWVSEYATWANAHDAGALASLGPDPKGEKGSRTFWRQKIGAPVGTMEEIENYAPGCKVAGGPDPIAAAVAAERERCADIINAARNGELDTDLRSIRHFIMSGTTRAAIRALKD